jgi:hypothetical protein
MDLDGLAGQYALDLAGTARLQAGYFDDRFVMRPGYEEAVAEYVRANARLVSGFRLELSPTHLVIISGDDVERLPIASATAGPGGLSLAVSWPEVGGRDPVVFAVRRLAPDLIQLCNPSLDLDRFAFRRQPSPA